MKYKMVWLGMIIFVVFSSAYIAYASDINLNVININLLDIGANNLNVSKNVTFQNLSSCTVKTGADGQAFCGSDLGGEGSLWKNGSMSMTGYWTNNYAIEAPWFNGKINCTNITGGGDGDFCNDAAGGGSGTNYWAVSGFWMFPNISASAVNNINATVLNATSINVSNLNVTGNAVTANLTTVGNHTIYNTFPAAGLKLVQMANTSASTSVGGALHLDNSQNTGAGMVVYSTQNANANGHLIVSRVNSATFDQDAIYATSNGAVDTVGFFYTGTAASAAALNLASTNLNYSALEVSGNESAYGTVKITHNSPMTWTDDSVAAALSINIDGNGSNPGTHAKGIYVYSDGNTTGDLLSLNNLGYRPLYVTYNGILALGANRTTMTCNSTYEGGLYFDGTTNTHYSCNGTIWRDVYASSSSTTCLAADGSYLYNDSTKIYQNTTVLNLTIRNVAENTTIDSSFWVNTTVGVTSTGKVCLNVGCSRYIVDNGTGVVIQG